MFIDYYKILEIQEFATQDEIKSAFKQRAFKWHPDRNNGIDTTVKMQEINEAYLILKDIEARALYDLTYFKYKQSFAYQQPYSQENTKMHSNDFVVEDEILKKWMENAHRQAMDLVKKMMSEVSDLSKEGLNAASSKIWEQLKIYAIISIAISILFSLAKGCG